MIEKTIEGIIDNLQWSADTKVVNDFNEYVWLKECFDEGGERIGITDCCFVDTPCEWHKEFAKVQIDKRSVVHGPQRGV